MTQTLRKESKKKNSQLTKGKEKEKTSVRSPVIRYNLYFAGSPIHLGTMERLLIVFELDNLIAGRSREARLRSCLQVRFLISVCREFQDVVVDVVIVIIGFDLFGVVTEFVRGGGTSNRTGTFLRLGNP